jgi:hypothetical protein
MLPVSLVALWLPILLSAVIVFIASSIVHMVLPWHRKDFARLPNEEEVLAALRKAGVGRGDYVFPCAESMKTMRSPEMHEKFKAGPVGFMTVRPSGTPAMGKNLSMWFVYCILVGIFAAYLAGRTLTPGTEYRPVFRVAGTAAFLGYAVSQWQESIWKGVAWGTTFRFTVDGLLYGLLTGGVFGWLWPTS